jgi:hypothetical protein
MKINFANFCGAFRTAGALMVGNAFVGYLVFEKPLLPLTYLFWMGFALIVLFSLEKRSS